MNTRDVMNELAAECGWTLTPAEDAYIGDRYSRGSICILVPFDRTGRIRDLTRFDGSIFLNYWPREQPGKAAILREWLTDPV